MIDRKTLVGRHDPVLREVDTSSPLTVGNGELAFTADVTGFQTLYDMYSRFPLCTMSSWGWHTELPDGKSYTLDDLALTEYRHGGRVFAYPVHPQQGNEDVYQWLRRNPHRANLARIALLWDGKELDAEAISGIYQRLELFTGILVSEFTLRPADARVRVRTACAQSADALGFSIEASDAAFDRLSVCICFPYASHKKNASDWEAQEKHATKVYNGAQMVRFDRMQDKDGYAVFLRGAESFKQIGTHSFSFTARAFAVAFARQSTMPEWTFERVASDSINHWERFWNEGGAVDFSRANDPRAFELERRTVLSQYLAAVHCSGSTPPQETGLSCNSWYGKFHLEMHILHAGWFPLWGHSSLLTRSFSWYEGILDAACENAKRNGFSGARWPKMVGPLGIDSPSTIAPLLIWQQPHLLYMLELVCRALPMDERLGFMRKYWRLARETARFMCSFARENKESGRRELAPPLIPAQEAHAPESALNPTFELCYWRFGLGLALRWAAELGEDCGEWRECWGLLADPPMSGRFGAELYIAHQNCQETFADYNRDHPSMLYAYGFIPADNVDPAAMSRTVDKVLECWERGSMWGWDYPLVAMTLMRLGRADEAIDILLAEEAKNYCAPNGNYYQRGRDDLPLYLPGNGSLLLAMAMLLAGYGDSGGCLPDNGSWDVDVEGVLPLPH